MAVQRNTGPFGLAAVRPGRLSGVTVEFSSEKDFCKTMFKRVKPNLSPNLKLSKMVVKPYPIPSVEICIALTLFSIKQIQEVKNTGT